MTDTPTDPVEQEPTDEELRSDEARRYRQRLRDTENTNADLIRQMADTAARAEAAERQAVTQALGGRFADADDFWSATELKDLRGDDGVIDMGAASQHANELLDAHPHWAAPDPRVPLTAPAGMVSSGKIGFPGSSVLDDNAELPSTRDWAQFLGDAQQTSSASDPTSGYQGKV